MIIADVALERRYLSAILNDGAALDACPLPIADLFSPAHQMVLGAAMALRAKGERVSTTSVQVELERAGSLQRVGGLNFLLSLTQVIELNPAAAASRIRELAKLRLVKQASAAALTACEDLSLDRARQCINEASDVFLESGEDEIVAFPELVARGIVAAVQSKETGTELVLGTPAVDADYRPSPGHIVIVGGRPNVGKTSLTFAWHISCAERSIPSIVVSVDDDDADYGARAIGGLSGVNPSRVWNERLRPEDLRRVMASVDKAKTLPLYFTKVRSKSIDMVEAAIARAVRVHGCRWASVDFLTKIRNQGGGRDTRERVNDTLARLGILASSLNIPIVVLVQINRGENEFREPNLSDFKESGNIEEDAAAAIVLWRRSDRKGEPVQGKLAKVKRTGAGRKFTLVRHADTGLLVQSDEHHDDEQAPWAPRRSR